MSTAQETDKIYYWIYIRTLLLGLACLTPFAHPHIIRQTDTLGVALRYWMRWIVEDEHQYPLLPAVLNSGDNYGISTMEFPLFNLLGAPFFALPHTFAIPLVRLSFILVSLFLTLWLRKIWIRKSNAGLAPESFALATLLLPVFTVSGLYFGKYMPDYIAFLLVSIGMAFAFNEKKVLLPIVFTSLGLLMKPPVVVALALLFLQKNFKQFFRSSAWVIPSLILTFLYYKPGLAWIKEVSDMDPYFYTSLRPPWQSLTEFLVYPGKIFKIFNEHLFTKFIGLPLVFLTLWQFYKMKSKKTFLLWPLLLLQILAVAALDGYHAFVHDYYFIGCSFICALILIELYRESGKKVRAVITLLILIPFLEKSVYEIRPIANFSNLPLYQCEKLKENNSDFPWNEGYSFRTEKRVTPELGICFGEKQNSQTSKYGFLKTGDNIPEDCEVVGKTHDFAVMKCL